MPALSVALPLMLSPQGAKPLGDPSHLQSLAKPSSEQHAASFVSVHSVPDSGGGGGRGGE
jgi:hypothetical protein